MAITAVALLRGSSVPDGLSGHALEDAVLVKTNIRFDLEPEDVAMALQARLGARLGEAFASEGRGVFVVPHVALEEAQAHRTHDAVVEAIGEAGMWVRPPAPTDTMEDRALGVDDILAQAMAGRPVSPAMLASLLGEHAFADDDEDDEDVESTAHDAEDEDGEGTETDAPVDLEALLASPALRGIFERMAGAVASSPDAQRELEGVASTGFDMASLAQSPAIAQLMQSFAAELSQSPEALAALLGGAAGDDDDE
jgi:hypothetical protein